MNQHGQAARLLAGVAIMVLVGGCAAGQGTPPASGSPVRVVVAPTTTTSDVVVTSDLAYESATTLPMPALLDVYAPATAGEWPVVVMFHGFQGSKDDQWVYARRLSELGFVVFAPTWDSSMPTVGGDTQASFSQAACAVEFARMHAAEYGGDPATMIVFGHSAGAHPASLVAFARPKPTAGCPGGTTLGEIDALVTWEGNWMLSATDPSIMDWDGVLAADRGIMDAVTPWTYLANHKDLKVVMVVSEHPGAFFEREVGDPWATDSWLAVRDPSGDKRHQLEKNGALADGVFDFVDSQQLLFSVLKAQGNPVSLDVMPGSRHDSLSDAGWKVFLAAFPKAAAKG